MSVDPIESYDVEFLRDELYAAHVRIASLEQLVAGLREENAVLAGDLTDMAQAVNLLRAIGGAK